MSPLLIGIAGGSGSGKTSLARGVARALGPHRVAMLAQDAYYRDRRDLLPSERAYLNYDVPDALDHALFQAHLAALGRGEPIAPPSYSFVTHCREGQGAVVEPRELVLVEGIMLLHDPVVRGVLDLKIFVDAPDGIRLARRVERDVAERGRTPESVLAQCRRTVLPAHARYVEPCRVLADLVILNAGRLESAVEVAAAVIRERLERRWRTLGASAA